MIVQLLVGNCQDFSRRALDEKIYVIFGDFFNDCVFVLSNLNYLIYKEFMVYAPVAQLDRATAF